MLCVCDVCVDSTLIWTWKGHVQQWVSDLKLVSCSLSISLKGVQWFVFSCTCLPLSDHPPHLHVVLAILLFAAGAMDIAHNTTITLTFHGRVPFPVWYMNGSLVWQQPLYKTGVDSNTGDFLGILKIDGNETCGNMTVSCRVEGQLVYTENLTIEGL